MQMLAASAKPRLQSDAEEASKVAASPKLGKSQRATTNLIWSISGIIETHPRVGKNIAVSCRADMVYSRWIFPVVALNTRN
jgi:hypothetical protein